MNNFSKLAVVLAMTAAIGSASVMAAETGEKANAGGPHKDWQKMTPEQKREKMAQRQAALHDKLKLTPAQEPAWSNFVAAITPSGAKDGKAGWGNHAEMEKLSAPERMEKQLAMSKEREARMNARLAALKPFYAVLTPEQKQIFNQETSRGRGHHGYHGGEARAKG